MPRLKNPRREAVVRAIAAGKTQAEAMRSAGYIYPNNATRMMRRDDMQARLKELQAQFEQRCAVSREELTQKLQQAYLTAMATDQVSAAVSSVKELATLHGLRVERQEMAPAGTFEALSDRDYANAILEHLQAAAMVFAAVKPPGSDTEQ